MEIDKTKQQKKLERFFMQPNWTPVLGLTVTKDTDIEDEEETHDEITQIVVKQKIKGTLFMTEKTMTTTLQNGEKMKEVSNVEVELKEGTRLIWLEGKGYVFPNENFKTMHEIAEDIENLKSLDLGE